MTKIIYLICGRPRMGKTTVGNFIKDFYDKNSSSKCAVTYFSKTLKNYAKDYFGWDGSPETKPRELLQYMGTDYIRNKLGKTDFVIKRTLEDIEILSSFFTIFVVDDTRFPMEIETCKELAKNVVSIKVERPNFDSDELTIEQKNHEVETSLDNYQKFDYIIINDGSLEDLEKKTIKIIGEIEKNMETADF